MIICSVWPGRDAYIKPLFAVCVLTDNPTVRSVYAQFFFSFFRYCAGQRFIAALSHTGGQARKNKLEVKLRLWFEGDDVKGMILNYYCIM